MPCPARLAALGCAVLTLLPAPACRSAPAERLDVEIGQVYYTRFPLRLDRNRYRSTNYRGGSGSVLLPINSKVEVTGFRRHGVTVALDTGREFLFEHVHRHTLDPMQRAFDNVFAAEPVDLSGFSSEELDAIDRGEAIVGMDRAAVLTALGPPPATGTLSLDVDEWKYWRTTFGPNSTFLVRFGPDGRVVDVGR